jgi:AdoMet-dependent rRNA methyltransferase SPB1
MKKGGREKKKLSVLQDDLQKYLDLLAGKGEANGKKKKETNKNSDDDMESSDSSDDEEDEDKEDKEDKERLISSDMPSLQSRTGKWFSNPIFASKPAVGVVSFENDEIKGDSDENEDDDEEDGKDVHLTQMPKTDKQKRSEKRKKEKERAERKQLKRNRDLVEDEDEEDEEDGLNGKNGKMRKMEGGIGIVSSTHHLPVDLLETVAETTKAIKAKKQSQVQQQQQQQQPSLVAEGTEKKDAKKEMVGKKGESVKKNGKEEKSKNGKVAAKKEEGSFEVISSEEQKQLIHETFPRIDERSYDSENEDYDSHDRIMTLALGTYMLRNSRKKALIDASYNRYSWNDPAELPTWFLDDEVRHNKPQLPVPHALVEQIKNKYQLTGTKVIKKEVEAKARKKKRAVLKLKAAKKQATIMAENSELSEKQKIKVCLSFFVSLFLLSHDISCSFSLS